jgi:hypothetical protein
MDSANGLIALCVCVCKVPKRNSRCSRDVLAGLAIIREQLHEKKQKGQHTYTQEKDKKNKSGL